MPNEVQPSYEILACPDGREMTKLIERAARTCYKSEEKIIGDSDLTLVMRLLDNGHMAMVEFGGDIVVKFISNRGFCYSEDMEVLTRHGWKQWPDIIGDEEFATLSQAGDIEYHLSQTAVARRYTGQMYEIQSQLIDLCVTPEHNMLVRKHDTQKAKRNEEQWQLLAARGIEGQHIHYKRNANPIAGTTDSVAIPKAKCDNSTYRHGHIFSPRMFARFLGYWISEGSLDHCDGSSYRITLTQNPGNILEKMRACLRELGFNPADNPNGIENNRRLSVCSYSLYKWLEPYHGALNKRIPRQIIEQYDHTILRELFDAYIEGDGSVHKESGHIQAYTISEGLKDDLQELALKLGMSATTWIDNRVGEHGGRPEIISNHPCHVISFVTCKNEPLVNSRGGNKHDKWIDYDGMVYCVTVPNHTLYVRRNGRPCWSGNSHELIRHRLASFAQESTRYCNYNKVKHGKKINIVPVPDEWLHMDGIPATKRAAKKFRAAFEACEEYYMELTKMGVPAQIAREVLPIGLKTEICIKVNPREWRHIFNLRCSKRAHPRMRELMIPLLHELHQRIPLLFDDLAKKYPST